MSFAASSALACLSRPRHTGSKGIAKAIVMTSGRQKKRIVKQGLRVLRNKPGWDPTSSANPSKGAVALDDALRDLARDEQLAETFATDAATCAACEALRASCKDETALCEEHLAVALGF